MADRPTQMLLEGLSRAVADPVGVPLLAGKTEPGLFPANTGGKQLAQRCKDEGYLRVVRTETRGKTPIEICTITEKGLAYLLDQVNPRQVLEDFIRTLEARHVQAGAMLASVRQMQESFDALKATAEKVLHHLHPTAIGPVAVSGNGSETWPLAVLDYLEQRRAAGASEDCPLPELFHRAQQTAPGLTIGRFHDALRRLHEEGRLYLHPWTGPLYDLPEPPYALLVGHEVAYYASLRRS